MNKQNQFKIAILGAGCFWGVQAAFEDLPGVVETTVGYSGGNLKNPTYEQVCAGNTGYVEVTRVVYDPERISHQELLDKFWQIHDPTQLNRQGSNVGEQYRSVIFYHNREQKKQAEDSLTARQKKLGKLIATTIEPAEPFYKAEEYHQHYQKKTGRKVC